MQREIDSPFVCVVVLNWNGWRDTAKCLVSLESMNYDNVLPVVVDNGSTDDSVWALRERFPEVPILETDTNLGFAAGSNVGIRHAFQLGAAYVWLLNNDAVVEPHALTELVTQAEEDPTVGAVGSVILDGADATTVQAWGGGILNMWTGQAKHLTRPGVPAYLTGASILLRVETLRTVGLLDEGFFFYWEDADISFRLRENGWIIAVAPESVVYHNESTSVGRFTFRRGVLYHASLVRFARLHSPCPTVTILAFMLDRSARDLYRARLGHLTGSWVGVIRGLVRGASK